MRARETGDEHTLRWKCMMQQETIELSTALSLDASMVDEQRVGATDE